MAGRWQSLSFRGERKTDSVQSVHPSGRGLAVSFAPFIKGMFGDAGLRRSWFGGRIIFDSRDFLEQFLEDAQRLLRILWNEESRFF